MTAEGMHLLVARGAADVPHPGGTLAAHLCRVGDRLAAHGAGEPVQAAGLCHAAYGTDGFRTALLHLDERPQLRDAIGPAAEAIVYRYASCDRAFVHPRVGEGPVPFRDRFTGAVTVVGAEVLVPFAALTVANELDVIDNSAHVTDAERMSVRSLLGRWRPLLTEAAWRDVCITLATRAGAVGGE